MTGLHRTAPLKFDHPGLDTAATHDGERLLIQNDIGTNDAHVLVIQVVARTIMLTYSDLHATRFAFFQRALAVKPDVRVRDGAEPIGRHPAFGLIVPFEIVVAAADEHARDRVAERPH